MKLQTVAELIQHSLIDGKISEKIVGDLLKISPTELYLKKISLTLPPAVIKNYKKIEKLIRDGVPLQYALGEADFYGLKFRVNKNVLIPRPETEIMLERAIKFAKGRKHLTAIDVGCGSGCIIISFAKNTKPSGYKLFGVDISCNALKIAKLNSKNNKTKIKFIESNLLENPKLPQKFDLILANLPYLPNNYLKIYPKKLSAQLKHEPDLALNGGSQGLELIKKLINILPQRLDENGLAILEIDPSQKPSITNITKKIGLKAEFMKDLNCRTRFALIEK